MTGNATDLLLRRAAVDSDIFPDASDAGATPEPSLSTSIGAADSLSAIAQQYVSRCGITAPIHAASSSAISAMTAASFRPERAGT
jgi:hypothetical protein